MALHPEAEADRANGRLIYHDGDLEDRQARLGDPVQLADMVLCPIDCVSHAACLALKSLCRKHCKALLFLRSSCNVYRRGNLQASDRGPSEDETLPG